MIHLKFSPQTSGSEVLFPPQVTLVTLPHFFQLDKSRPREKENSFHPDQDVGREFAGAASPPRHTNGTGIAQVSLFN
jgi:hypothetical protein